MSGSGQTILTSAPGSNFHINLVFDASTASAPAGFVTQIVQAASYLDALFTNPITINLRVGWGETGDDPMDNSQAYAEGGPSSVYLVKYATLKSFLSASATSADDHTSVAHLPANDPLGHPNNYDWLITSTQLRLFDPADFPTGSVIDGSIGFSTKWTSDWLGGALHELTHAMARVGGTDANSPPYLFDLFRYDSSASGHHLQLIGGNPAYFSIDGGATKLADFGVSSDYADFKNDSLTPHDPFDEVVSGDTWTRLDSRVMDVLGFTLNPNPPPPPGVSSPPDLVASGFGFDGSTASWQVLNSGAGAAAPSTTGVYLSVDKTINASDSLLGTFATPSLAPGGSDAESLALNLPHNLKPGTYYLGALANETGSVSESKTSNDASGTVPILLGDDHANALKATSAVHLVLAFGGDDVVTAGPGSDVIDGGAGTDTAVFSGAFAKFAVAAAGGGYTVTGASGSASLSNVEILQFSDRQMVLGSTGETLTARQKQDALVGGSGDDTLIAAPGKDVLTGGAGHDHFVFPSIQDLKVNAPDQITDFVSGQDRIDLSALHGLISGGGPFHLGVTAGHAGDITVSYDATHDRTVIDLFTNGDAKADGVIWLNGHHTDLIAGDFVL